MLMVGQTCSVSQPAWSIPFFVAAGGTNADEGGWLSFTTVMTVTGLAVAVLLGSFFTAQAVVAGDVPATLIRFVTSIGVGVFYLYLFRLSQGHRYFQS